MNDLIDTTEMYLRTIFELEEEGIVPLRARIAERLAQSGPTVSQTVARMERDGLLSLADDRHLELTDEGRERATTVMRKHRLAERLLTDVIGLEWAQVHIEACRWEHVMSDEVERRLVELLDDPNVSPYGNPIPRLDESGMTSAAARAAVETADPGISALDAAAQGGAFEVLRIIEVVQNQPEPMAQLAAAGLRPGATVSLSQRGEHVSAAGSGDAVLLSADTAAGIRVRPAQGS